MIKQQTTILPSAALGMIIFIFTEVMLFAAFISAYLIVSAGALDWQPINQPRLPAMATGFNTVVLFFSGIFLFLASRSFSRGVADETKKFLFLSLTAGLFFVLFQGAEWVRLIGYGLTMTSSVYGSFFYLLIGAHGLHAVAAILLLWVMYFRFRKDRLTRESFLAAQFFWYFVVGVWPILYGLVYF